MFRDRYYGANNYVEMTEGMDRSVLANMGKRRRRWVLAAVAAAMLAVILMPMFLFNGRVFLWLSEVAPPLAELARPPREGVRMRVEAAGVRDGTLELCVTFEDVEGDRLSADTLLESCRLQELKQNLPQPQYEFDPQTGTLRCRFAAALPQGWEEQAEGFLTLEVGTLRPGGNAPKEQVDIPITLHPEDGTVLASIQEGCDITAMEVRDELFHIWVREDRTRGFRDYDLVLYGPNGEKIAQSEGRTTIQSGVTTRHYLFVLRDRSISDCTLTAVLNQTENITGPWTMPFRLEAAE